MKNQAEIPDSFPPPDDGTDPAAAEAVASAEAATPKAILTGLPGRLARYGARLEAVLARPWGPPLLLALAVALVYGRSVGFGLTNWDDDVALTGNALIQDFRLESLRQIWTPGGVKHEMLYIPFLYTVHWLEIGLGGFHPWLLHLNNVLLHGLCAWGVYALVRHRLARLPAFAAALIFALHPLQVETVAWATGRKDLLAGALALGAILAWHRWLARPSAGWYALTLGCFVLALLSKPSVVTLPVILGGYGVYQLGWGAWRRLMLPLALPGAMSAVAYVLTSRLKTPTPPDAPEMWWRVAALPYAAWGWMKRLLMFEGPRPQYLWPTQADGLVMLGAAMLCLVVAVSMAVLVRRSEGRWLFCLLGITAAAMLPAVSIVLGYRDFITADRYAYLAMLPLAELVALGIPAGLRGLSTLGSVEATGQLWERYSGAVMAALIVAMAVSASLQVGVWRSSITLWKTVLRDYPHSASAHNSLGRALDDLGDLDGARYHYHEAVTLAPTHYRAWNNLGNLQRAAGNPVAAMASLQEAIALNPSYFDARFNLGLAALDANQPAAAAAAFRDALNLRPTYAPAAYGLAAAFDALGEPEKAATVRQHAEALEAGDGE